MKTDNDNARSQAQANMLSISAMVSALGVDYARLHDLEGMDATDMTPDELEELEALREAAGDCEDLEDAEQRILESPLDISVRTGWYSPGSAPEPEEFQILLCTGGPAVRIRGELDAGKEPARAWLEYQDWGTPWAEYHGDGMNANDLLKYSRRFYFGE